MVKLFDVSPLRIYCQKVLPLVYDDSLSYYEVLCKVVDYINHLIESQKEISQAIIDLRDELMQYLNDLDENIENIVDQVIAQYFEEHPEIVIADGSVITSKIANGAVTTAKIANGAVTADKLSSDLIAELKNNVNVLYLFPEMTNTADTSIRGSCFLAVTPEKTILFDGGSASAWDPIYTALTNWYSQGLFTNIDILVISHFHADHVANVGNILSAFPHTGLVAYMPPQATGADNWAAISAYRTQLLSALTNAGVPNDDQHRIVIDDDSTVQLLEDSIYMTFCNTKSTDYNYYNDNDNDYNNYSMVTTLYVGKTSMLYPGDLLATGQERVLATHDIQRPAIYVMHHHGFQNDDYLPWMMRVNADIVINEVTHKSAVVDINNEASSAMSYFTGWKGSAAYCDYIVLQSSSGATVIDGIEKLRGGVQYTDYHFYVDNTYTGTVHDGSEDHPFTEINEAINWIPEANNTRVYIEVKPTASIYRYVWLLNIRATVLIRRDPDVVSGTVLAAGMFVKGCTNVTVQNLKFKGVGRALHSRRIAVYAEASTLQLSSCELTGVDMTAAEPHTGLTASLATVYVSGCTFDTFYHAVDGYLFGTIFASGNSFSGCEASCYNTAHLDLYIDTADTLTSMPEDSLWIMAGTSTPAPVKLARNVITSGNIAYVGDDVVSVPFYRSQNHPLVVIVGKHMYEWTDALSEVNVTT